MRQHVVLHPEGASVSELARVLEWLGAQAGRLPDPATLARVARGLEQGRGLLASVQRDLARSAPQREADHGR